MPVDAGFQTWLVVLGAIIGFASSILTLIITRWMDSRGRIGLYYRFSISDDSQGRAWNFQKIPLGVSFQIPIVYELQNTTNATKVIRDVSLFLFKGDELVAKMYQGTKYQETLKTDNKVTDRINHIYGDDGSYSFALPPCSIQNRICFYFFTIADQEIERYHFNNIRLRYYDEKNREIWYKVRQVGECWKPKQFAPDDDWKLLKK